jgi:serine/threonine-protein kinase
MIVSPDGTLAAYSSNESGQPEVYLRSFPEPGGLTIVSEGGGSIPFWSSDGSTLFYTSEGRPFTAARIERDPVPVVVSREDAFSPTGVTVRPFQGSALHPDGDRFVLGVAASFNDAAPGSERFVLVTNWFTELRERLGEN